MPAQKRGFGLSSRPFTCQAARQPNDLAALCCDVMVDDDGIGKPRPVEVAVDLGRDNSLAVAVGDVDDIEGDLCLEDLMIAPRLDRGRAAELPADIIDNGLV